MSMRKARYGAALAVGALALSACSSGGGGNAAGSSGTAVQAKVQNVSLGTPADSVGPAVAVAGAKKGGTVTDLEPDGFDHLDPGQLYVNDVQAVGLLFSRALTGYKIDPKTGKTSLVGDLATDTGEPSADSKTWTYHLKSGLKYEDGTPITSQDIKYGVERLYAPFETAGPIYVQTWLSGNDYRKKYTGPYGGKSLPDSVISTPNSSTIVFHFLAPHADAPFAMAEPNISPIPKAKDTKQQYDNHPVSSGPYKIASYNPGKSLILTRNKYWDPKTDPIRNAYPDTWNFDLSIAQPGLTRRLMQQAGSDKDAVSLSAAADPTQMASLISGSQYKSRTVAAYQPFVDVFNINMSRVKDVRVREAIMYAFPLKQIQQDVGGAAEGDLGTNLIGPTVTGFKPYDPFGKLKTPQGDPAKAKALLKQAGVKNLKLTYAFANMGKWQDVAVDMKAAFAKAGINLQTKPIDQTSYYTLVGKVNNPYDIYRTGWGADWPNGSTVIPPTQDGRLIADEGPNYSHLDDPHVNSEIDRIGKITNVKEQQAAWQTLAEYIMKKDVPEVPYLYDKYYNVYGDGLGGVSYNPVIGVINPNSVYVK
jgi:peptide/nickel transport system substrate-binding protein